VIAAGGKLGGYGRDLNRKRNLLLAEDVVVSRNTIRDFAAKRWTHRDRSR
jgi:alkylated DNA nucleotide flippase Atl1